jgi:TM2 domain-containing membrane protein YozV
MNDKLRKHVDILFAAAPKTQRAAEVKEELLTNLNDKYNDLLANGYDSTAAFHIALSGIGDIDELFKECGGESGFSPTPMQSEQRETNWDNKLRRVVFILAIILLSLVILSFVSVAVSSIVAGVASLSTSGIRFGNSLYVFNPVMLVFLLMCLLAGIALIVYVIVRSAMQSRDESLKEYSESVQPPPVQWDVPPVTSVALNPVTQQVVRKRPLWLLLLTSFVFFLIALAIPLHPDSRTSAFELVFIFGALSLAMFILYVILRVTIGIEETRIVAWERVSPSGSLSPAFQTVTQGDITFKRIVAGILGILLGWLGVHKFYLGFIGTGLTMLLLTVLSLGILSPVVGIIGFIEGILYLLKSDRDFYRDYEVRRRNWF